MLTSRAAAEDTILGLAQVPADAASIAFDSANNALFAWKRYTDDNSRNKDNVRPPHRRDEQHKDVCEKWGVGVTASGSGPLGSTVFSSSSASAGMSSSSVGVSFNHTSFGGWLVCGTEEGPVLNYWDQNASGSPDWDNCGQARLNLVKAR